MNKEAFYEVLRQARTGTLSLLDFELGIPFGTMVNVAVDTQDCPLFLFSSLSRHVKSLKANPPSSAEGSLLVTDIIPSSDDPLTALRGTIAGRFEPTTDREVFEQYLAKHPYAGMYSQFGDFSFWRMVPKHVYVVGGFGRVYDFSVG